jgi:nucleotide-binding universal stress UspA family protein
VSFRRIMIAVDGEPLAFHAAEAGVGLAQALAAEVALIYVLEPLLAQAPGISPAELTAQDEKEGRGALDDALRLLPQGLSATRFMPVGEPAAEIVRAARGWGADLIVVGSHARHGLGRILLGSVAEAVMRHAGCPVLVVRKDG